MAGEADKELTLSALACHKVCQFLLWAKFYYGNEKIKAVEGLGKKLPC